ncbi:MAG: hypothetical protein HJJLKODD_01969 [Phycisphaerae bacterium]|nr:hypothetical protein [Phycisphaerae bacterium]
MSNPSEPTMLFEMAWEVCSQVGGIYTVLRSKAPAAVDYWGAGYWLVGPYREATARIEFETQPPPDYLLPALEELRNYGLVIHCGCWLVTGRPQVLLIELGPIYARLGHIRHTLWVDAGIGTPDNDGETHEVVAFGHAVADLLTVINRHLPERPMLAHFHEWQGAAAIPFLQRRPRSFATVFTTHATLIGRSLSAANVNLYEHIGSINPEAVAYEHNFAHRYFIERAAAHGADIFTTVSEITALEAERFLGRRPEVVLPNGLNIERFAAPHEFQLLHRQSKELIHEFVMGHFFPTYTFDLDRTLYFFTAGRYEYRNKGMDLFIDALAWLNQRLRTEGPRGLVVVAFIISKAPYRNLNVETLNRQMMFNEVQRTCTSIREAMSPHLLEAVTCGRMPTLDDLLDEYATVRLKRMIHSWKRPNMPTIITHDLHDDQQDPILAQLRRVRLFNFADDPVKVVFHPEFLSADNPLFGMDYDQFVRGCNLGVFPSYYEPWGYTPLDCVVRGVPSITSDLSGFGTYVRRHFPKHEQHGLLVASRREATYDMTVQQVGRWMHDLARRSRRQRIKQRNHVESYAEQFDWHHLLQHYIDAWQLAGSKRYPDRTVLPNRRMRRRRR